MDSPVIVYCDGLCEPAYPGGKRNPGGAACGGWVILANPVAGIAADIEGCAVYAVGEGATNNLAEYRAARDALAALYRTGYRGPVELRTDSQLVVNQVNGEWACNYAHLREWRDRVRCGLDAFGKARIRWVPREQNERADALSRRALTQAQAQDRLRRERAEGVKERTVTPA